MFFTVFIFSIFGLVRQQVAFDAIDNSQSAWVCNKKIHLSCVILKIPKKIY
jgi:hypothetical protein